MFVATDEPKVLTELSLRFPKFHWVTRNGTSDESASILKNRYSNNGQDAIIKDVFVLAFSDFLVSYVILFLKSYFLYDVENLEPNLMLSITSV